MRDREHVGGFVPGPAQDVPPPTARVTAPLLHVPCHVIGSVGAEPLVASDPCRASSAEVAHFKDVRINAVPGRLVPVEDRREALSGELRVSSRLKPAHTADGKFVLAFRIGSQLPGGGTGTPGGIAELPHRLFPGEGPSFLDERVLPVSAVLVSSPVYELLELSVCNF